MKTEIRKQINEAKNLVDSLYKAASQAFDNEDLELQKFLYTQADKIQLVLNTLCEKESDIFKTTPPAVKFNLDDFSEIK
jgi:hypothetical protein